MITIISAVDLNGVIGDSTTNKMPWYDKEEMQFFKSMTINKKIVMGRKTAESVGPLKERENFVLTRNKDYSLEGFKSISYLEILNQFYNDKEMSTDQEIMITGGAEIYQMFLPVCDQIILSVLDLESEPIKPIYFPEIPERFNNYKVIKSSKTFTSYLINNGNID